MMELRDPFSERRRETGGLALSFAAVFAAGVFADWLIVVLAVAVAGATLLRFWFYIARCRAWADLRVEIVRGRVLASMTEDEIVDALYAAGPLTGHSLGDRRWHG